MKGLLYKDLITVACAGRRSLPVILLVYLAAAVVADAPAMVATAQDRLDRLARALRAMGLDRPGGPRAGLS